MFELAASCKSS